MELERTLRGTVRVKVYLHDRHTTIVNMLVFKKQICQYSQMAPSGCATHSAFAGGGRAFNRLVFLVGPVPILGSQQLL